MTAEPFRIGLLGHGTVGRAFAELLEERAGAIESEVGRRPEISGVLTRSRGNFDDILERSDLVVELNDPRVGDVLVIPATGAYSHAMANNYNAVPRPPVIFCRDGDARVVVRRETYEDLTLRDR